MERGGVKEREREGMNREREESDGAIERKIGRKKGK